MVLSTTSTPVTDPAVHELHGGTISAEFRIDGGTRFVLQLPKML